MITTLCRASAGVSLGSEKPKSVAENPKGASSRVVTVLSAPAGGSLTGSTVIRKVWGALVSTPPLAVPPLSRIRNVTVALPLALAAGV